MDTQDSRVTTGIPSLDGVLKGLILGDNVVWEVSSIDDYIKFVRPFAAQSAKDGRKLIYFRFASHQPLLDRSSGAEIHELNPEEGFESFITLIHETIEKTGRGSFYVFDCLSELAGDWYSERLVVPTSVAPAARKR